jgi:hypothetical protein
MTIPCEEQVTETLAEILQDLSGIVGASIFTGFFVSDRSIFVGLVFSFVVVAVFHVTARYVAWSNDFTPSRDERLEDIQDGVQDLKEMEDTEPVSDSESQEQEDGEETNIGTTEATLEENSE